MSYILDALKKSEQDREQDALPILRTAPRIDSRDRRLRLVLFLAAVVVAVSVAAVWVIGPRVLDKAWNVPESSTAADDTAAMPAASPATPQSAGIDAPESRTGARGAQPAAAQPDQAGGAGRFGALDAATRARVKDLSVNVVSYSDVPERRFAMIDQRIVRESEIVADGVVVERIVPDGVVLSVGAKEVLLKPQ